MFSGLKRNWMIIGFAIVNLTIAAPAGASLDDDVCVGSGGDLIGCCTACYFFCNCTLI